MNLTRIKASLEAVVPEDLNPIQIVGNSPLPTHQVWVGIKRVKENKFEVTCTIEKHASRTSFPYGSLKFTTNTLSGIGKVIEDRVIEHITKR